MEASIRAIDTTSVHRIHSGQVVLDLQSCLKELVENALDAGATSIEVRIKDHGLSTIEVSDNGSGISSADWPMIGLKHHTSKLPDLALLPSVTTFGFRGEAVSALCALCEGVTVITSTKEMEPMGAVIQLGRDGRVLDSTGRVARPRGTTITLTNLFHPLPVRRKEFERNSKRELTKALTLLTAYALVPASSTAASPGVRIKVDSLNSGKASKRSTLLANDGRGSLRASVMAVWGAKALDGVTDVDLDLAVEVDKMVKREGGTKGDQEVKVRGLLSSAAWGQGRSSADRQYFYVNGRPADLRSVQKVVNETYKSFNTHQVPLAILDFTIPRESVDINVSPDKRTIMLHSESNLLTALRLKLEDFFAPSRNSFAVEGATQTVRAVKATQSRLEMATMTASSTAAEASDNASPKPSAGEDDRNRASSHDDGGPTHNDEQVRFRAHPVGERRSHINAEAGPSRPAPPSREAVVVLDEEEEGESEQSSSHSVSRPTSSRSRPLHQAPVPLQRQPLVATPASSPASPARKRTKGTLSTAQASWSPDRSAKTAGSSGGGARGAVSGRDARKSLRERLKMYSQAVPAEDEDDGDEVDASAGGFVEQDADIEVEYQEGEEEDEDGPVELDSETDGEPTEQTATLERGLQAHSGEQEHFTEQEGVQPMDDDEDDDDHDDHDDDEPMPLMAATGAADGSASKQDVDMEDTDGVEARLDGDATFNQPGVTRGRLADSTDKPSSFPTSRKTHLSSYRSEIPSTAASGEIILSFSLPRLQARYRAITTRSQPGTRTLDGPSSTLKTALSRGGVTSEAGISNRDLQSAEEALARVISKADFGRMEVVGQFNKGFIIARLRRPVSRGAGSDTRGGTDDLFIVDQHASDEKFNFETLQQTTRIKGQALIKPRSLELTAADELTAIENIDVLKANGFEVAIDEDKAPGRGERLKLMAMPVSKETVFDFKDLEQLLHLLSDSAHASGQMVRCTKARSMFAMRACRKSVMIGKSLTTGQMTQLLKNMGTIDQPWNCPHGRPTMRHLTTIEAGRKDLGKRKIDWTSWRP